MIAYLTDLKITLKITLQNPGWTPQPTYEAAHRTTTAPQAKKDLDIRCSQLDRVAGPSLDA
jgi:hypothetical protein